MKEFYRREKNAGTYRLIPVELNQNFNKSNTILQSNYNSGVWWYFLGLRFWYFWHLQNLLTWNVMCIYFALQTLLVDFDQ